MHVEIEDVVEPDKVPSRKKGYHNPKETIAGIKAAADARGKNAQRTLDGIGEAKPGIAG